MRCLAQGLTTLQGAHRMGVTRHTFDTYLRRIKAKRGVHNRAGFILLGLDLDVPGRGPQDLDVPASP